MARRAPKTHTETVTRGVAGCKYSTYIQCVYIQYVHDSGRAWKHAGRGRLTCQI